MGPARRSARAGSFQGPPSPEVLRPMGRRNPSRADRCRRSPSPAGRGHPRGCDRAGLPSRLRGSGALLKLHRGARGGARDVVRPASARGGRGKGDSPHRVSRPARARDLHLRFGGGHMSTVVISAYKVANFSDGGGHFWVYMQYVQGLRLLGCEVYWLEQLRPAGDLEQEARLVSAFLDRMKHFGLEGRTLLYALDRDREGDAGSIRFIRRTPSQAPGVVRPAGLG